jgi:hypothetical protein
MKRQIAEMASFLLIKTVLPFVKILLQKENSEKIRLRRETVQKMYKIEEEILVKIQGDPRVSIHFREFINLFLLFLPNQEICSTLKREQQLFLRDCMD